MNCTRIYVILLFLFHPQWTTRKTLPKNDSKSDMNLQHVIWSSNTVFSVAVMRSSAKCVRLAQSCFWWDAACYRAWVFIIYEWSFKIEEDVLIKVGGVVGGGICVREEQVALGTVLMDTRGFLFFFSCLFYFRSFLPNAWPYVIFSPFVLPCH